MEFGLRYYDESFEGLSCGRRGREYADNFGGRGSIFVQVCKLREVRYLYSWEGEGQQSVEGLER